MNICYYVIIYDIKHTLFGIVNTICDHGLKKQRTGLFKIVRLKYHEGDFYKQNGILF